MRIESIHIESAPGLPDGLPPLELPPGLVVVVGPNASGKSTLAKALRALLWPGDVHSGARVRSRWRVGQAEHTAELFDGRVSWQPALPFSPPSTAAGLARLGTRTLLASDDDDDRELSRRVARELAGGLDLQDALDQFPLPVRLAANTKLARNLREAHEKLRESTARTDSLAGKELQLARIKDAIKAANSAAQRKVAAEALHDLVLAKAKVARLAAEAFSPGLEELVGDEDTRIRELANKLSSTDGELADIETKLQDLNEQVSKKAFPDGPPSRENLDTWSGRLDRLKDTARQVDELIVDVGAAAHICDEARAEVLGDSGAADLSRALLDDLASHIADDRAARAAADALRKPVASWEAWAQGADQDPAPLRDVVRNLRLWLSSPEDAGTPTGVAPPGGLSWALIVAGVACFGIAIATSLPWLAAGLILTGFGAGQLLATRRRFGGGRFLTRAACQQAVERTALAPGSWEPALVESHLEELESRLGHIEQAHRAVDRLAEARGVLKEAEQALEVTTGKLKESARRAGVSEVFVDLGTVQQVHALIRWLDAREAHAERNTKLKRVQLALDEGLAEFASWLDLLGFEASSDVPAAQATWRTVEHRRKDLHDAERDIAVADRDHSTKLEARGKIERELSELWNRTGVEVDDLAALARHLEERKVWAAHREAQREAEMQLTGCRERFALTGELAELEGGDPESVSVDQVDEWIASLSEEAEQRDTLNTERGGIAKEIDLATRGHALSDALARVRDAQQQVSAERERAAEDALARMLLDQARETHEMAHAPTVLRRAQSLFGRFTHDGWRLAVDRGGAFCALDVGAGELRSLEELSDGTRAQLLLAARLGALEELEPGAEKVPLCLDEALANSDPVRFHAIVEALFELTDSGRQIIYLTADPLEAARWRQVCVDLKRPELSVIDLAVLRGDPVDWGGILPAMPPLPEVVPDPGSSTPAEYARAIDLSPPDGFRDVVAWHLYFVAYDDLEALAACLRRRMTTVGHWREAEIRGNTPPDVSAEVAERLNARVSLAETLTRLWRIGRGRPVTWETVDASEAVSEVFEEPARALLADHARDPKRFVTEVRALKHFQKTKARELGDYLEQVGCLPTEDPLLSDEIVRRCLEATVEATETLGPQQAAAFVTWLLGLLEAGMPPSDLEAREPGAHSGSEEVEKAGGGGLHELTEQQSGDQGQGQA